MYFSIHTHYYYILFVLFVDLICGYFIIRKKLKEKKNL